MRRLPNSLYAIGRIHHRTQRCEGSLLKVRELRGGGGKGGKGGHGGKMIQTMYAQVNK
jgi:hypothetical protein